MTIKIATKLLEEALTLVGSQKCDQFTVVADETGWSIYCIDPSHTSMAYITMNAAAFAEYGVVPSFNVNVERLLTALKNIDAETVDFTVGGGRITVSGGGMTSKVPLLMFEDAPRRFPDMDFDADVQIDVEALRRIIKTGEAGKTYQIKLEIDETTGFQMVAEDDDGIGTTLNLSVDDCAYIEGAARSYYGWAMLRDGVKAIPRHQLVTVRFRSDAPLIVSWSGTGWEMKWLLAPWINTEDE